LSWRELRWLTLLAIVMAGVHFVVAPLFTASLAVTGTPAATQTASMLLEQYGWLLALRFALVFVGAGILGLFLYQNAVRADRLRAVSVLAYTAFVTVFASELAGRFLFYATYARDGLM